MRPLQLTRQLALFLFVLFNLSTTSFGQVADALTIDPSGNIGIGTTTPSAKLEVNGRIKDEVGYVMPKGCIILWSGAVPDIPAGWALCDGSKNTPDLRGKFIVGAGGTYNVNKQGGAEYVTLDETMVPAHNHGGHSNIDGNHTHSITRNGGNILGYTWEYAAGTHTISSGKDDGGHVPLITTEDGNHTHPINSSGGGQHHENRPPYWALCYIMKL